MEKISKLKNKGTQQGKQLAWHTKLWERPKRITGAIVGGNAGNFYMISIHWVMGPEMCRVFGKVLWHNPTSGTLGRGGVEGYLGKRERGKSNTGSI